MSVLASLIAALERAGGERLVLRTGETPHILSGGTRHDLGTTKVSVKALEALAQQILSPDARREFAETNAVLEPLSDAVSPIPLIVGTHRSGDQIRIELRRLGPTPAAVGAPASATVVAAAAEPQPLPVPVPPPLVDPHIPPPPPITTPPAPDESDWTPIEGAAAAAKNAPPQASVEPELAVGAAAMEAVAVPEARAEPPATAPPMPVEPKLLPVEAETIRIPRSELGRALAVAQGATPLAPAPLPHSAEATSESVPVAAESRETEPIPIAAAVEPPEEVSAPGDDTSPEAEEIPVPSRPLKVVPITSATTKLGPPAGGELTIVTDSKGRSDATALEYWIRQAARRDATALYLRAGHAPVVRARQKVQPLTDDALDGAVIDAVSAALAAGEDEWQAVSHGEWAREFVGVGAVTCQAFTDDLGTGLVVHLSSQTSASTLEKDVPRQVRRACEEDDGLVIVAAPTAADVMHMVAVVGEWTAQRRAGYLISIEPPNGLGHNITGILVSARRIAGTERDVAAAIRRATHEEPDILVVAVASGLIAEEALRAAKPGRLVIVGAIAPTAPRAVDALLNGVSWESEQALRESLAASFRCGFSYRPLPGRRGGRAVVHDVLLDTSEVRARLERWDLGGLERLQRTGAGGMRSLDTALAGAVHRGDISLRRAAGLAIDRRELVRLVRQAARERIRAAQERPGDRSPGAVRAVEGAAIA